MTRPEGVEDFPFGPDIRVFKICGRMYATLAWSKGVASMNLKCDPHEAQILRDLFEAVRPGYHMNKAHWNTLILDGSIPRGEIERMIDNSYALVVRKLRRVERRRLEITHGVDAIYSGN